MSGDIAVYKRLVYYGESHGVILPFTAFSTARSYSFSL